MSKRSSDLKPMSPIEFMVRSDLRRHIETATLLRKVRASRSWQKDKELKHLTFEELLEEKYDRAPEWFNRVSGILDEHPPSKILANWRRFAPEFEEREEDFDWGDS
ncbi:MAG: hypothetical protein ACYSX0_05990 [Planctomycetota bacterium]